MKVKLLKKLRKKYSWYFNSEKFPVLINHDTKKVTVYDKQYCMEVRDITNESEFESRVKVTVDEWCLRILKYDILHKYGYEYSRGLYKLANMKLKNKITKNNIL